MTELKPTRCINPVMKFCQDCQYGHNIYPAWVETAEDLEGCLRGLVDKQNNIIDMIDSDLKEMVGKK